MSSGSAIPYDPTSLEQRIDSQLAGLGELATYLTRSASTFAQAGPSQAARTGSRTGTGNQSEEEMEMRRVHLGDEWWADMTEQEMVDYLERKQTELRSLQERIQDTPYSRVELEAVGIEKSPRAPEPKKGSSGSQPSPTSVPNPAMEEHSESSSDPDSSDDDESPPTRPTRLIPALIANAIPDQTDGSKEEPPRGIRDISKAIDTLPASLQGPLKEILAAKDGTEVVNEEGLPVIDIREEVKPGQTDKGGEAGKVQEQRKGKEAGKVVEVDEYWSEAAIARRKKLREQLFNSDDSEDEDDDGDSGSRSGSRSTSSALEPSVKEADSAKKMESSAPAPKPGFMLASRELKHSTPEDVATIDLVDSIPDISERTTKGTADKGKGKDVSPSPASKDVDAGQDEQESVSIPRRRKSVTFAAQAKVRTYEKGEAIPVVDRPADEQGETKQAAQVAPVVVEKKQGQGSDKLFGGFKKGFLNQSGKTPTRVVASPKVSLSKSSTKIEMIEDVASPAVSVKTAQVASQRKIQSPTRAPAPSPSSSTAAPFRSEVVMDPDFALPPDLQAQLDQMTGGTTSFSEPDTLQPLAPSHDDPAGASRSNAKGKSLFAMRNQALASSLIPKRDTTASMTSADASAADGAIGTGASRFDRAGDPMKFKVVEKPPRPAEKRAVNEVSENMPLKAAPKPKKAVGGIVERNGAAKSTSGDFEAIPLPEPETISGHQAQAAELHKQLNANHRAGGEGVSGAPEDISDENEDDADSNKSYEYSDTESVNFDMDRGLMAREAAMAYHQKRSALGRKALGGWTGVVDEDGKTGFYTHNDEIDQAQIKSEAVSFGEKLLPGANLRSFDVSKEDDDDDDDIPSVNLPTIIPGADNLPSMIRVGKLENGNLILQAEDESEDEFADAPEGLKRETEEQKAWRADFREKMAAKDKKKEIVARLGKGEVDELIKEDEERENQIKETRVIKEHNAFLPQLREEGVSIKKPLDETVTERTRKTPLVGAVKETGNAPAVKVDDELAAANPKKVSRFKAARMANA